MKKLLDAAKSALKNSYSPYSNFAVGAAVIDNKGRIFTGCNIENASFGASICAERTAIAKGISFGAKSFSAIAVVSSKGGLTYPCGICLQVINEFFSPSGKIYLQDKKGEVFVFSLSELLPKGFKLEGI